MLGLPRCLGFGGSRIDAAIGTEILRAISPLAVEAGHEAERLAMTAGRERHRVADLELQQAHYEASLAERRYAACDPDNSLIAAQLERAWEAALRRVEACQARIDEDRSEQPSIDPKALHGLANDLSAAMNAPGASNRTRQRLVRALVTEIVADVDEATRKVVLVIHWRGGAHSELRVRKPRTGEHGCRTPEEALAVIRSMAARWSDEQVRPRSTAWACAPARASPGRRTASTPSAASMASTPTARPKRRRVADHVGSRAIARRQRARHPPPH